MRAYYSGGWQTGGQSRSQVEEICLKELDLENNDMFHLGSAAPV